MDKAAKKARKEEKHRNKQKDASSKEKKATQTLAIVLGMICYFISIFLRLRRKTIESCPGGTLGSRNWCSQYVGRNVSEMSR